MRMRDLHRAEYTSWLHMVWRCTNPCSKDWPYYGGKGIGVDPRWRKFVNFFTDLGVRPFGTTLHRIDSDLGYCKSNCKWATSEEQANNKSNSVRVTP